MENQDPSPDWPLPHWGKRRRMAGHDSEVSTFDLEYFFIMCWHQHSYQCLVFRTFEMKWMYALVAHTISISLSDLFAFFSLSRMVASYLVHHSYCATAEAFAKSTDQAVHEELASIKNRQSEFPQSIQVGCSDSCRAIWVCLIKINKKQINSIYFLKGALCIFFVQNYKIFRVNIPSILLPKCIFLFFLSYPDSRW